MSMDELMCRACGILQPCDCERSWLNEPEEPGELCPICGYHTAIVLGRRRDTEILRCEGCGEDFTFIPPEEERLP